LHCLDPSANDHGPQRQADLDRIQHVFLSPATHLFVFSLINAWCDKERQLKFRAVVVRRRKNVAASERR
ncbi:hypothetical protein ABTK76_19390, partial [Acinetobacter baumannii]